MNIKSVLWFLALLLPGAYVFAQSPVSVNPVTGTASVTIPVYTVTSGPISVPIYFQYNATGVKNKDAENTAGVQWQLYAGGQISRIVRGLPDDCTKDSANNAMTGWMQAVNSGAAYAGTFVPQNDGSGSCTKETADISNINTNMPYNYDTEPDLFYVSAPGLSCQLVYDRNDTAAVKFHPVIYQDLKITYTTVTGTGRHAGNITSFTITNDKGIQYYFAAPEMVTQFTAPPSAGPGGYFNTRYNQYVHGIKFADAWNLVKITDPYKNVVNFVYNPAPVRYSADKVLIYINGAGALQYTVNQATVPQVLDSVYAANNALTTRYHLFFSWKTLNQTAESGATVIDSISGFGHTFMFTYTPVVSSNSVGGFTRSFLTGYTDVGYAGSGCGTPVNYKFSYIGQTTTGSINYTTLPDSNSTNVDYWGYFSTAPSTGGILPPYVGVLNPLAGTTYPRYVIDASGLTTGDYSYATLGSSSMMVTPSTVTVASLGQITYPQGGTTSFVYEPNSYLDVPSGTTVNGGGIRIKQITDYDGVSTANNMVRNYTYGNGAPVTLPQYAFTVPYSGAATGPALYVACTALSQYDLSAEDHTIMYSHVTISRTGAGSTASTYGNQHMYWDANSATVADFARYSCPTPSYGPTGNFAYWYPFIHNTNYDYQRGLLTATVNYNDAGTEVSETDYTYQPTFTSTGIINAFYGDDYPGYGLTAKGYNIYNVLYNTGQLVSTVTNKVFDSQTLTAAQTSTVNYFYNSPYHRLLTQQQTTSSDNTVLNSYYTYAKDYPDATNATNANVAAIYNMRLQNINAPIETYRQVTVPGGSPVTTNASLTLFRDTTVGIARAIPSKTYAWQKSDSNPTFNHLVVTATGITISPGYINTANYTIFDATCFPVTVDDNNRNIRTTVLDHLSGQPTAVFSNAAYNQMAFSDFDTDAGTPQSCSFAISGYESFVPATGHAGIAYGLGTTQTVSATVAKSSLATNYIFSVWLNANAGVSGSLSIKLNGGTAIPLAFTGTGNWVYYEKQLPVSILATPLTISFTSNQVVAVDDIIFYPDVSEVATVTYDQVQHYKIAQTNTNGVSSYFTNDLWGRVLYAYDQDKNMAQKNNYVNAADAAAYAPAIAYTGAIQPNIAQSYSINNPVFCNTEGSMVTWNFGDGSAPVTTAVTAPTLHTYTASGNYTITAVVTSPVFGARTVTAPVTVQGNITLSLSNGLPSGYGNLVSLTFSKGGVVKYSFNSTTIAGAVILQDIYDISATVTNPMLQTGYSCSIGNTCWWGCSNYTAASSLTFNYTGANLFSCTTLPVVLSTIPCGTPP